ncbi:pentapeptide repeat-containing protein [Actinoplanes aureus]|uniref:Pentapeptide repeat-containing protein n=1 Tax=Actinoplanes aureus TaxID=2792083 RepID=A0A931C5B5_9ACTN|nr:pentapeptide repeat-containing protein [Actinoplanes aureus]MBG0560738.1 pentapeptide repeat-containing protein [Actinoplanes aureus]
MLAVALVGIAVLTRMWLIAGDVTGADRAKLQIEALKYALGFSAAAGAAAALLLAVRRQKLSERAHQLELQKQDHELRKQEHVERHAERLRELELRRQEHSEDDAAERRVTELYTKAIEQLGHTDAAVRLGGLYALERLAQNNPRQRQTIVNVMCAYLRMPYTPPAEGDSAVTSPSATAELPLPTLRPSAEGRDPHQELQVRLTAQRILTTHLCRPDDAIPELAPKYAADPRQSFWPGIDLDLTGAHLIGWNLTRGSVRNAQFSNATFSGNASFGGVTFSGDASFDEVTFSGDAKFDGATLFSGNASFNGVTFSGDAGFDGVTFSRNAWFGRVRFSREARFGRARFSGNAWFAAARFSADFSDASFDQATFSGDAEFGRAKFSGDAKFDQATFSGGASFDQATFSGDARFAGVTFSGDAEFGQATFSGDAEFGGATSDFPDHLAFYEARVADRPGRRDVWPSGWHLVPDGDRSKLIYDVAGSLCEHQQPPREIISYRPRD